MRKALSGSALLYAAVSCVFALFSSTGVIAAPAGSLEGRGVYEIEKMGLQNGIPLGAKERAIRQLRALPLATPTGSWLAIGPRPVMNGQGLGSRGWCGTPTTPPVSGRVTSIAFGGVAGTIYLGTAGGGVWKTTDNGVNWSPLTDQQVSLAIGALAVVPRSDGQDIIYAGTGESNQAGDNNFGLGILKSADGGQTWTQLAASTFQNQGFARIAVVPGTSTGSDVVYAATMETVIGSATSVVIGYAVKAGLFRSEDGGATWQMLSGSGGLPAGGQINGSASEVIVNPANGDIIYAGILGGARGGIWQSTDAGATWTRVPGMPQNIRRVAISISPDGNTLYAGLTTLKNNNAVLTTNFVSTDAGVKWKKIALPPVITGTNCFSLDLDQGGYNLAIQSDPSNPATVYEALVGIYKSTNSGKSWRYVGNGTHSDFHALVFNSASLYAGSDGGVFVTNDGGKHWDASLNQKLNTIQFQSAVAAPVGTTAVVGGTQDNGTNVYTDDADLAWSQQEGGDGGISAITLVKSGIVFGESQFEQKEGPRDHVFRFMVGKTAVTGISPPYTKNDRGQFYTPLILDPNDDDRLLIATNRIWESCQAGVSLKCNATTGKKLNWRTSSKFFAAPLTGIAIAPTDPAVLYAVTDTTQKGDKTEGPFVFVTGDSDAQSPHYTDVSDNLKSAGIASGITSVAISPINSEVAAVSATGFTGGGGHVFLTQDSGHSWTDISTTDFPDNPTLAVYFDQNDVTGRTLFVGTSIGMVETTDLGKSWTNLSLNQLPLVQVYSIAENADTVTIATHGRGVWQLRIAK